MAKLILVGLPIGNAQDITKRVSEVLSKQRHFLVEDTRNFKSLLNHYELPVGEYRLEAFHDHNKELVEKIISRMDRGENIYLASDAGSPVLSDPAFPLVKAALDHQHEVDSLPGVSSPIVALELSGLPPHPFTFWGFLPRKEQAKEKWFDELTEQVTHICFESPMRMKDTIETFYRLHQKRESGSKITFCISRELTKLYQESVRFDLSEWPEVAPTLTFRGEMILLIYKNMGTDQSLRQSGWEIQKFANDYLSKQTPRNLSKLLSCILGGKSSEYYDQLGKAKK